MGNGQILDSRRIVEYDAEYLSIKMKRYMKFIMGYTPNSPPATMVDQRLARVAEARSRLAPLLQGRGLP